MNGWPCVDFVPPYIYISSSMFFRRTWGYTLKARGWRRLGTLGDLDEAQVRMRNSLKMGIYVNVVGMLLALIGAEQIVGTLVAKVLYSQGGEKIIRPLRVAPCGSSCPVAHLCNRHSDRALCAWWKIRSRPFCLKLVETSAVFGIRGRVSTLCHASKYRCPAASISTASFSRSFLPSVVFQRL